MIFYFVIWNRCFMLININNLILLTFFHLFCSEFSDILYNEDDFSFSEFVDSISDCVFFKFKMIEAYSRLEFVISKKWKHSNCYWHKNIKCVFCHKQSICSIVLLMIDVNTQITFYFLTENLALFICFRMKCCEQFRFNFKHFTNRILNERYELRFFIKNHRDR